MALFLVETASILMARQLSYASGKNTLEGFYAATYFDYGFALGAG
jgi:hypothetical protein